MKKYAAISAIICVALVIGGLVVYAECNANQSPTAITADICPTHGTMPQCTQMHYYSDSSCGTDANIFCAANTGGSGCLLYGTYTKVWYKTAAVTCQTTGCPADASNGEVSEQGETGKYIISQTNCGG